MRKMRPADVRTDFDTALQDVLDFYATVKAQLASDKDKTLLVRNTLITGASLWESFVNDMFIAYINGDNAQFQIHLSNAFKANRTPKQDLIAEKFTTVTYPKHMTVELITDLIDSTGNNLTFSTYDDLKKGAAKFLTAANRAGIDGLSDARKATIDLWIALRNHIAHDSQRSYDAMNVAMAAGGLHGTGLQRGVNEVKHVGAWLKAVPVGGVKPRIEMILDDMKATALLL